MTNMITVETTVSAPVAKAWEAFTNPEHVVKWNNASDDWHTPQAVNDLKPGGTFSYRMEAKDGSSGFDFTGVYDDVVPHKRIAYTMNDGRTVEVIFESADQGTRVVERFDPEQENSAEVQKAGWQAILDNFKKYVEAQ